MDDNQVRLAVLEQKVEDMKPIILRLDSAIQKLSDVNITVSRMLAIHEERISKQEEVDTILFAKVDKLRDKMDINHDSVLERLGYLEKKVWIILGCGLALSMLVNTGFIKDRISGQELTQVTQSSIMDSSYFS